MQANTPNQYEETVGECMLSNLMKAAGASLTGLGGAYVGHHLEGQLSFYALIAFAFAVGIVWLSQAPTIALRRRVGELEAKVAGPDRQRG